MLCKQAHSWLWVLKTEKVVTGKAAVNCNAHFLLWSGEQKANKYTLGSRQTQMLQTSCFPKAASPTRDAVGEASLGFVIGQPRCTLWLFTSE